MALNDDVMDDIPNTIVDDNIIRGPSVVPVKQEPVQIIAANGVTGDPTNLTEASLAKLPSMDVKFKLVEDQTTTVVTLQEVEASILSNESICKSDVSELVSIYPDMLSGIVSIEHYTKTRTKTCYKDTLQFIKKQRALEELCLVSSIRDFIDVPVADATVLLDRMCEFYIPTVIQQISDIKCLTASVNVNAVVMMDTAIVNLYKVGIETIDFNTVKVGGIDGTLLNKASANINKALGSHFTNTFIHQTISDKSVADIATIAQITEHTGKSLTIDDMLSFYNSSIVLDNINALCVIAKESITKLSNVKDGVGSNLENGSVAATYVTVNSEMIIDMIKNINLLTTLVFNLNVINENAKLLLEFVKTL